MNKLNTVWNEIKNVESEVVSEVGKLCNELDAETKVMVPVTINILTVVRNVMNSPVEDAFVAILNVATSGVDSALIAKIETTVKTFLPVAITGLTLVNIIANITDPNLQLQAILAQLKLSSNATQNAYLHSLSAMILQDLVEGMTWAKAVQICQYYYDNEANLSKTAT